MRKKIVGVIGGLGPEATLDFFGKIVEATTAATDQDHLHLIIDNNPGAPDRTEAVAGVGPSPASSLACSALRLEQAGAEYIVMVCNTAHAFASAITDVVQIPFLSIIEVTCEAAMVALPSLRRVGVLATAGTLSAGLYRDEFRTHGVERLALEGASRARFMDLILRIKAGDKSREVRVGMRALALELVERGAEVIIAGCTEVPLVLDGADLDCPLVNSTDALVTRTIQYASDAANDAASDAASDAANDAASDAANDAADEVAVRGPEVGVAAPFEMPLVLDGADLQRPVAAAAKARRSRASAYANAPAHEVA